MPTELPADISLAGLNFTRAQEGRALRAYRDSVGVWTVGYGLTNFDNGLPWKVAKGLTITEDQAEWYLVKSLRENYLPAVKRALDGGSYLNPQGVLDGANDFHFNTGGIEKASWPAALKRGDNEAAKASLLSWNKGGGKVLAGLVRRRAANWAEFSGDYGHVTGPSVIEPGEDDNERAAGVGDLLTEFPADPGDPSTRTVQSHGIPAPSTPAPGVCQFGSEGAPVIELQNLLTEAGYPTLATGVFDADTVGNVRAFQASHPDLTNDGKVGPATRESLKRVIAMRNSANVILKSGPLIPAAYIGFHQFVSAHAGNVALVVGIVAFLAVVGCTVWKYREASRAWINSMLGRIVT